jgi:hypothetical protein
MSLSVADIRLPRELASRSERETAAVFGVNRASARPGASGRGHTWEVATAQVA